VELGATLSIWKLRKTRKKEVRKKRILKRVARKVRKTRRKSAIKMVMLRWTTTIRP
jgi:hypothetical protein